jgi:hypothetical protein
MNGEKIVKFIDPLLCTVDQVRNALYDIHVFWGRFTCTSEFEALNEIRKQCSLPQFKRQEVFPHNAPQDYDSIV